MNAQPLGNTGNSSIPLTVKPESPPSLLRSCLQALGWTTLAVLALHLAYIQEFTQPLITIYFFALLQLARQVCWRVALYSGLLVGFTIGMLHLEFFYTLFGMGAVGLWLVFGFWTGLFVALARLAFRQFGWSRGLLLIPFLWTGLEYFRSELYYLRFAWVTPGFSFANLPWTAGYNLLGVFGLGFLSIALVCAALAFRKTQLRIIGLVLSIVILSLLPKVTLDAKKEPAPGNLRVAGIQMEFPTENEVMIRLRELLRRHPGVELVVLSEYTFDGPVPGKILDWCAMHQKYLVLGGKEPASNPSCFYNTAYVIGPNGKVVFQQVKAVPIQFMKDGLPAERQELWNSPWGRIGICICYDLSYTRVTDALVKLGAQALIVPTMDVIDWGEAQHRLHARVAPVRAAEYGLPIFRVASSGISQLVDHSGKTLATAPFGGEGGVITGNLAVAPNGRLPLDRLLAPVCVAITGGFGLFSFLTMVLGWREKRLRKREGSLRSFAEHPQ